MPRGVLPVPRPSGRTSPAWAELDLEGAYAEAVEETAPERLAALDATRRTQPLTQYQQDPEGFCVDVLGIPRHTIRWSLVGGYEGHEWDGTPDPLANVLQGLATWENVAVESATGVGKSFLGAAITLWFLASWRGARVFTFAPKEDQLRLYIWAEMGKMWPAFSRQFPQASMQDLRLYMDPDSADREAWSAVGYAVSVRAGETVSTKAAGMHAEHMLLITEETPGIQPAVLEAHENTCTAPHNLRLALGNVDSKTDSLHQLAIRPSFRAVRISAYDHPNVVRDDPTIVPGAVSRKSIESRREKYGEKHRLYESRVRGIAPDEAEDALVRLAWLETAAERAEVWREKAKQASWPVAYGVDVANSESGDHAAVSRWRGPYMGRITSRPCPNATDLGTAVWTQGQADGVSPEHIGVDAIGVGAATVNELNRLASAGRAANSRVVASLHGGGAPKKRLAKGSEGEGWQVDANLFANLRAQMYWQFREDVRCGRVAIERDPELFEELTAVQYEVKGGKVLIQSKDEIRHKLGRSPNKADAAVYGNWVRPRTEPPPAMPANAIDRDHGVRKGIDGKVRPRTFKEAAIDRHPGLAGRPVVGNPWDSWGTR
jgi:phage terminase large subunit